MKGRQMSRFQKLLSGSLYFVTTVLTIIVTFTAGWAVHIAHCFKRREYALMLIGAVVVPLGSIHGVGLLFGWWE